MACVEQDKLGQAFEDAFEVLRQHSTGDFQYSPGKDVSPLLCVGHIHTHENNNLNRKDPFYPVHLGSVLKAEIKQDYPP